MSVMHSWGKEDPIFSDILFTHCPWSIVKEHVHDDAVWSLVDWWIEWRDFKLLPFGSSELGDEPNYAVEAIKICQDTFTECEIEASKRAEKKAGEA